MTYIPEKSQKFVLRDIEDIINDNKAEFRDFDDSEDDWKILLTVITNGYKKNHAFKILVINSGLDEIDEDKIIYILVGSMEIHPNANLQKTTTDLNFC